MLRNQRPGCDHLWRAADGPADADRGCGRCGKTLFALTFLVNGATRFDEPGVLMSFEERPEDLAANSRLARL